MAELVNAFNCRSELHSLKTVGLCRNPWLVLSVLLSGACMVVVIQWPPLAALFHTGSLTWEDWLLAAALSLGLIPVVETAKWRLRRPQLL
jgi:Ca2+-transporting ATPase